MSHGNRVTLRVSVFFHSCVVLTLWHESYCWRFDTQMLNACNIPASLSCVMSPIFVVRCIWVKAATFCVLFCRKIPQFTLTTRQVKAFLSSQLLRLSASSIMKTALATKGNILWTFNTQNRVSHVSIYFSVTHRWNTSNLVLLLLHKTEKINLYSLHSLGNIHCLSKNVTTLSHHNSDIPESVLIISGTNVTEKAGNQKVLYFFTCSN